jgi:isochorismate synthase
LLQFLLQKKLAFAIWSLPGELSWQGIAQNNNDINIIDLKDIYSAKGFIVAPFEINDGMSLIRPDIEFDSKNFSLENDSEDDTEQLFLDSEVKDITIIDKNGYLDSCEQLISRIKQGEADKVILSRVIAVPFDANKIIRFFKTLVNELKDAMVFIYSIGNEIWIGASPEIFIEIKNNQFKTVALAGSKHSDDDNAWGQKEIEEQNYVVRYVQHQLNDSGIAYNESELKTVKAGPVAHLQTIFNGKIEEAQIPIVIDKLHPTPAVCGIPKEHSKAMILETEKHFRGDYTGFIGPVNKGDMNLFVNLRSAIVTQDQMYLFVGGGLTSDSIPEKEWKETGLKALTLLNCYKNC